MDSQNPTDRPVLRQPTLVERGIELAAKGMIAFTMVVGGLAGLALFGFWAGGLAFREWAEQRGTPGAWLVLVFVIFPLCGVAYLVLEGAAESLHQRWPDKTTDPLWRRVLWLVGFLTMAALAAAAFWVVRAIVI